MIRPITFLLLGAVAAWCFGYALLAMTVPARAASCAGKMVVVSYYGKETCRPGRKCQTADETDFDGTQMLAAHRTLPFGTMVKFTYNGRTVKLPIRDRGPYISSRTYDVSEAAARKLGFIRAGVVKLCAERL